MNMVITLKFCKNLFNSQYSINNVQLLSFDQLTFDVYEAVEEANGLEEKEVSQVLHAHFERIPVIQFEMGVH